MWMTEPSRVGQFGITGLAHSMILFMIKNQLRRVIPQSVRSNFRSLIKTSRWLVDHLSYFVSGPKGVSRPE
jgi:hypothetical protein